MSGSDVGGDDLVHVDSLVTNKLSLRIFCEDFQRTPAMAGMMLNRVSEQAAAIAARPKQVR